MKIILKLLLLFLPATAIAQSPDTLYYSFGVLDNERESFVTSYRIFHNGIDSGYHARFRFKEYKTLKGSCSSGLSMKGELLTVHPEIRDGRFEGRDELGNKFVALYRNNHFLDIIDYRNDENQRIDEIYSAGMLNLNADFYGNLLRLVDTIRSVIELTEENLDNISNPGAHILFIINEDGTTSNHEFLYGLDTKTNKQIIEFLLHSKLKPAELRGEKVKSTIILPIDIGIRVRE